MNCIFFASYEKQMPGFRQVCHKPVADLGFPRQGSPTSKMGAQTYYFAKFLPPNCMKMKEFGPRGRIFGTPLDPPLQTLWYIICTDPEFLWGAPTFGP